VSYVPGRVQSVERPSRGDIPRGYGEDSGGGNTVGLLQYLVNRFGDVASFSGTYRANRWTVNMIQEGLDRVICLFAQAHNQCLILGCDTLPTISAPCKTFTH